MRFLKGGACATAAALCLGAPAWSQTFEGNAADSAAEFGGYQPQVDVIGNILYNSNVSQTSSEVAAARGLQTGDVVFSPAVDLNLSKPIGLGDIYLKGSLGYTFYAINTNLNRERINLTGGANTHFLLCRENWSGNVSRQQSELYTTSVLVTNNTTQLEHISLETECGHDVGFAPSFSVSQKWDTNSNPLDQLNNYRTFAATVTLGYKQPSIGMIGFFGEFNQVIYDNRSIEINGNVLTSGFDTYTGGVRYTPRLGSRISGSATLSYTDLEPLIQGGATFQGVTYAINGVYEVGERLGLYADFYRRVEPSTFTDASFSVNEGEHISARYEASTRIRLNLTGSAETITYHGALLLPDISLTQQTLYSIVGSATYKVNRRVGLTFRVGGRHRDANQPGLSYSAVEAGVGANAAF
jgi:hypothetical protein